MNKSAKDFFNKDQEKAIIQAIRNAEVDTSGEIKVHIENHQTEDVKERAAAIFQKLNIQKTEQRNGVLFYIAIKSRAFAVLGDIGINAVVDERFWDHIKFIMIKYFREGDFANGIIEGINATGTQLKKHFPYKKNDINELSDEISYDDNI